MAALSTFVGTTELEELVPTELIPQFVQSSEFTSMVGTRIAWMEAGVGSIARRFPRYNAISSVPAGTKTETDTFTDVNIDTTESTITPGIVGLRLPISDEAMVMTVLGPGIQRSVLEEALRAVENRMDADVLSSITSATNTVGAATDNFTDAKFRAAAAAYRALDIPDGPAGVALAVHHDGFRDLEESLGASAATIVPSEVDVSMFGSMAGFHGSYHGFSIFSSGNIPANASNWAGAMTPIGSRASGLGIVQSEPVRVVISNGDESAQRAVTFMVVRAWYGTGLTNPNRLLEVLHRT